MNRSGRWMWTDQSDAYVLMRPMCEARCEILSSAMNVARPALSRFKLSMHACAVETVSTTMLSKRPQHVEMATSYLASMPPRSPCKHKNHTIVNFCTKPRNRSDANLPSDPERRASVRCSSFASDSRPVCCCVAFAALRWISLQSKAEIRIH